MGVALGRAKAVELIHKMSSEFQFGKPNYIATDIPIRKLNDHGIHVVPVRKAWVATNIVIRKSDGPGILDICQSTRCHQNSSRIGYVSDDCGIHVEFFKNINQNSSLESPTSNPYSDQNIWWPRNSSRILIRILELRLDIR